MLSIFTFLEMQSIEIIATNSLYNADQMCFLNTQIIVTVKQTHLVYRARTIYPQTKTPLKTT